MNFTLGCVIFEFGALFFSLAATPAYEHFFSGMNLPGLVYIFLGNLYKAIPGLVNLVPLVAYLFCLNLPAAISQPGKGLIEIPCTFVNIPAGILTEFIQTRS